MWCEMVLNGWEMVSCERTGRLWSEMAEKGWDTQAEKGQTIDPFTA
jgi:hypothetical protein